MSHRERPTLRLPDHVCGTDGAPLIEVFSVSIDTYGKDEMKIYGHITITDGEGVTFNLYSREMNNPETVTTTGQALSLTFPEYRAISPKGVVEVDVCLMEVNREAMMIRDHREWDYSSKNDYEMPQTEIFKGVGFSAVLKYITYHCAVIGYPKVTILPRKKGGVVDGDDAQVYGRIVASRIRKHQCNIESGATTNEIIVLFDEPKDKPVALKYGTTYGLFGAMVVPAYSYVEINAWLQDGITDRVIANDDDGIALDSLSFGYEGKFCGSSLEVEVGITWCHPYLQPLPLPTRELKRSLETSSSGSEIVDDSESDEEKSYAQLLSQQSPSTAMRRNRTLPWKVKDDWVISSVMEIFSVSVGHKISKLFGCILVSDIFDQCLRIYDRDQHSPDDLSESNEVGTPIEVVGTRRVITGDMFSVHLDLKDEEGRQVSDGHFQWRNDVKYPFFGKRMCCVVTGKHGYAAVHYTVFEAGLPARVEASLSSSVPGEYKIYGVIWSEYGNNKCVTYYEQAFYRNRHFVSPQKDPLKLCFESPFSMEAKIPLSKAVVGVPKGSSLDLYVQLYVENDEGFDEQFRHNVICKFGDPVSLDFKEKWFTLHLDMKWNCW